MKYFMLIPLAAAFLLSACAKDNLRDDFSVQTRATDKFDRNANLVSICHKIGNGQYNVIQVNLSDVPAHLQHGDYLLDLDGDGYTAIGACAGSMDDSDDYNASIHPGAKSVKTTTTAIVTAKPMEKIRIEN